MRRIVLLGALAALGACRHVPPDKEARAVVLPQVRRRVPEAAELHGAWIADTVRGSLATLGHVGLYVFRADGRYHGTVASAEEAIPIEGGYRYENGVLDLDHGALRLQAAMLSDGSLELVAEDTFLHLSKPVARD